MGIYTRATNPRRNDRSLYLNLASRYRAIARVLLIRFVYNNKKRRVAHTDEIRLRLSRSAVGETLYGKKIQ